MRLSPRSKGLSQRSSPHGIHEQGPLETAALFLCPERRIVEPSTAEVVMRLRQIALVAKDLEPIAKTLHDVFGMNHK